MARAFRLMAGLGRGSPTRSSWAHRGADGEPTRRRARRSLPGAIRTVPVLAALALVLSGCLSSGYAYFNHNNPDGTDLFFKLPGKWMTFNSTQIIESENGHLTRSQLSQIEGEQWQVWFAGSNRATIKQVGSADDFPTGKVFASELSADDRDALDFSSLRATFLGVDPLETTSSQYNVLDYTEFSKPGGVRGSKMVVNISAPSGLVTTFEQVVAVDPQTNWLFGIGIGCAARCFGPNEGLINQVVNSWTVKELKT